MNKLFPKITAILLGAVFLMGGAMVASAADPSIVYIYRYKVNSAETTPLQTVQFPTLEACRTSHATAPSYSKTPCTGTPSTTVALLNQSETVRINALADAASIRADNDIIGRLHCGIPVTDFSENKVQDCIPVTLYYLVYKPTSFLLAGAGYIFDAMLTLSIDSSFINQDFINSTWGVVRDFSNMLFIFILLYAGVQTILGMGDWRKTVLMVVVMALLINFSLFFTKVVIDAGNVLAVGIYSSMGTPKSIEDQSFQIPGVVPERDISGSLAGAFKPQSFLVVSKEVTAMDATVVFIIAALVSAFAGYILFKAALLFVRRLIIFWALMIVSPFAFISIALPGKANKFSEWLHELISQAFVVPVFLFFIYIIMKAISAGDGILGSMIKTVPATGGGFVFQQVLMPVMIAALIIKALELALEFSESMAGSTGASFSGLVSGAMGIATGGASSIVAGVGRGVGGRLAQGLYEKGTFTKMATNENSAFSRFAGRQLVGMNEKARTGTWDTRGVGLVQQAAKTAGISHMGKPGAEAKGGFEGAMKRQDQADKKFAEKLKLTQQEKDVIEKTATETITKVDNTIKEKETIVKAASEKLAAAEGAVQTFSMNNGGQLDPNLSQLLEKAKKEKEEADAALALAEQAKATTKTAGQIIEEEEKARRESYAKYIEERGKIIGAAGGVTGTIAGAAGIAAAGPLGAAAYIAGMGGVVGGYSNEQAQRTAAKIREGGKDAKPSDEGKALKELVKKLKEEQEKEG